VRSSHSAEIEVHLQPRQRASVPILEGDYNEEAPRKSRCVTGGSSGTGLATAKRFVEEGAFVYITGRRQRELDKAVSLISPGPIDTPIFDQQAPTKEGADQARAQFAAAVPFGRLGRPEEIASTAFCSAQTRVDQAAIEGERNRVADHELRKFRMRGIDEHVGFSARMHRRYLEAQ
jgi:NAD(P)-dependent dehydrogenase (short-subunit alcohol dehydrogenase family)